MCETVTITIDGETVETAEGASSLSEYPNRVNLSGTRTGWLGTSGKLALKIHFGDGHRRGKPYGAVKLSGQRQGPTRQAVVKCLGGWAFFD